MKQFQFAYKGEDDFLNNIKKIKQWCNASVTSKILFQIYTESLNQSKIKSICALIEKEMPDAVYMGASTNGNILMGKINQGGISIICTAFEYLSTQVEIFQYALDDSKEAYVTSDLIDKVKERSWVKSVMLYCTIRGMSMSNFCDDLRGLPRNIELFGGGAFSEDMNENAAFVFSSSGMISDHAVVFALIGGDDYFVQTTHITGWKPLGRELLVTKAKGPLLYELDGKPAYDTYYKYLNIKNDENFFVNTLEFPFFYEHNGINILRAPTASDEAGVLTMTADMEENVRARIAYGDPWTILESVYNGAVSFREFIPETITVFSCAARRTFWGVEEISNETLPFQSMAPTSGFYTSGEFLRTKSYVNQHNVTLVVAAQREGTVEGKALPEIDMNTEEFSGKVSMINRLATFIQAATEELEEANLQLGQMAISDGMTRLFNRTEIQRRITCKVREMEASGSHGRVPTGVSLIMMDIDNFKKVNDTYGHKEGDVVLIKLADMLKRVVNENSPGASIGRWGGEEFMVLLPNADSKRATDIAELFRTSFAAIEFEYAKHQTMSLGVTELIAGESADISCMRVDDALYEAKNTGKNRVVVK